MVHGKGTIVNKIYGNDDERRRQARVLYLYMLVHPGKKLNFMGNELAQFREWDEKRSLDFFLLEDPAHKSFHEYMKALNHLYLHSPALSEEDYEKEGFEWADCHQEDKLIYAITRRSRKQTLLTVFNLNNKEQNYSVKLPDDNTKAKLIFSTAENTSNFNVSDGTLNVTLPPYAGLVFYVSK